jgi:RIO-like serine/threonine protein kinase
VLQVAHAMKLDVNGLRYLSKEEFRTLQAVELGQKNVRSGLCSQT